MRILLAAEESAGIQALRAVSQSDHEIVAVLADSHAGDDRPLGATVESVARHMGHPVWPASLLKDREFCAAVRDQAVDLLLNVHSLHIVHEDVLSAFRIGAFNLHPGPLPRYAGMNAPSWSIFNGETEHAVTLHWMEKGIDTGSIAYQSTFDLGGDDTGLSVSRQCVRLGIQLIRELLSSHPGDIPRLAQSAAERRYYGYQIPFGGRLDCNNKALVVERFVRACNFYPLNSPWGTPRANYADKELGLVEVSLTNQACDVAPGVLKVHGDGLYDGLYLATADEWLEIKRVLCNGRLIAAAELI
jgi:UDP-4-amino-4-deoxy-L-arabinose formyltransferase/UDP-glucuronic acid dehydrogenase (UDP-4-keto-hexauronic acid decarboxylating)